MKRDQTPSPSIAGDKPASRAIPTALLGQEDIKVLVSALHITAIDIYEIDLNKDSVHVIISSNPTRMHLSLTGRFVEDTLRQAEGCIHPDDHDSFLRFFSIDAIRHRLESGNTVPHEYRSINADGVYRWIAGRFLPSRDAPPGKVLLICQDITEAKLAEKARLSLERRYAAIFRQSYDAVTEVNLDTGRYIRSSHHEGATHFSHQHNYSELLGITLQSIHPDDRKIVAESRSLENLRRSFGFDAEATCQYRIRINAKEIWVESRAVFIFEDTIRWAFLLARDITEQKHIEEERDFQKQRFNLALRDTYTEIYEYDLQNNTSTLLFANSERLLPVGIGECCRTEDIIKHAIHPDDRNRVWKSLKGINLYAAFAQGKSQVMEDFRRIGRDGGYYWVSAAVVPLRERESISSKAMLVIKDISERREREQRLRISQQYDRALRNIYDELYELNITQNSYRIVYHVYDKYVTPPDEGLLNENIKSVVTAMVHPDDRERFIAFFDIASIREHFASGQEYCIGEFRKLWRDGKFRWAALTLFPVTITQGDDEIYLVFIMDIDARKHAEEIEHQNVFLERQRIADERYRIIMEQTNTLIFEWCPENKTQFISPELMRRYSGNYDERNLLDVWKEDNAIHSEDLTQFNSFLKDCQSKNYQEMTVRFRRRKGGFIWCKVALSCLSDPENRIHRYIGTFNDVDAATRSVLALRYRAEYDTLTGVYNMHTFNARASELIRSFPERQYHIIRMDIDRFKIINDLYGMEEGDRLLRAFAGLVGEHMTPHTVCGRLGGDIFCACVDFTHKRILAFIQEIDERLFLYPLPSRIALSFGVCRVDSIDTPINVLCDWANLALKTVKGNVLVSYAFYDEKLRRSIIEEKRVESEMHDALAQEQFCLYLQPKVDIATSSIVGSEGLVRWNHPHDGIVTPENFIPLFEKNGFIIRLDEYIWEQTCIVLRRWLNCGHKVMPISVNVSRIHIHDVRLCEKLIGLVARYQIPPHLLELELTESVFLDSENQLFESIKKLQQAGFLFSLDDFGAGYSSLNILKSLPIDTIKIDRGFLNEVVSTERGKIIIRHTIALAADMNIHVIAEGVETAEQAAFLLGANCGVAQGFFYSKPVPVSEFENMAFHTPHPFPIPPEVLSLGKKN